MHTPGILDHSGVDLQRVAQLNPNPNPPLSTRRILDLSGGILDHTASILDQPGTDLQHVVQVNSNPEPPLSTPIHAWFLTTYPCTSRVRPTSCRHLVPARVFNN